MDCIAASFQVEGCAAQRFGGVQIQGDMPRRRFAEPHRDRFVFLDRRNVHTGRRGRDDVYGLQGIWSERSANRPA
jgi:hypothetical protein